MLSSLIPHYRLPPSKRETRFTIHLVPIFCVTLLFAGVSRADVIYTFNSEPSIFGAGTPLTGSITLTDAAAAGGPAFGVDVLAWDWSWGTASAHSADFNVFGFGFGGVVVSGTNLIFAESGTGSIAFNSVDASGNGGRLAIAHFDGPGDYVRIYDDVLSIPTLILSNGFVPHIPGHTFGVIASVAVPELSAFILAALSLLSLGIVKLIPRRA